MSNPGEPCAAEPPSPTSVTPGAPEPPPCCRQCVTHAVWRLPSQTASRLDPRSARIASSSELATAETTAPATAPPPRAPSLLSRQIPHGRPRLEPELNRSGPPDRDRTAWIQGYRFGLALFLKKPPVLSISTRGPSLFRNICRTALFSCKDPPEFLGYRTRRPIKVVLHVSPYNFQVFRFRPSVFAEKPQKLSFLAVKPLNLVLGLVFAF